MERHLLALWIENAELSTLDDGLYGALQRVTKRNVADAGCA